MMTTKERSVLKASAKGLVLVLAVMALGPTTCASACYGPANTPGPSDYMTCGTEKCRIGWEECSTGRPLRCIPAYQGRRADAGAGEAAP